MTDVVIVTTQTGVVVVKPPAAPPVVVIGSPGVGGGVNLGDTLQGQVLFNLDGQKIGGSEQLRFDEEGLHLGNVVQMTPIALLETLRDGTFEYDGQVLTFTVGDTRHQLAPAIGGGSGTERFFYKADANTQNMSDPGTGRMRWNADPQTDATILIFDWITDSGFDPVQLFLNNEVAEEFTIQDADFSLNHQVWRMTGPAVNGPDYFWVPVELVSTSGAGSFNHNTRVAVLVTLGSGLSLAGTLPGQVLFNLDGEKIGGSDKLTFDSEPGGDGFFVRAEESDGESCTLTVKPSAIAFTHRAVTGIIDAVELVGPSFFGVNQSALQPTVDWRVGLGSAGRRWREFHTLSIFAQQATFTGDVEFNGDIYIQGELFVPGAGGGVGASTDQQVLFNSGGAVAGSDNLMFDSVSNKLQLSGGVPGNVLQLGYASIQSLDQGVAIPLHITADPINFWTENNTHLGFRIGPQTITCGYPIAAPITLKGPEGVYIRFANVAGDEVAHFGIGPPSGGPIEHSIAIGKDALKLALAAGGYTHIAIGGGALASLPSTSPAYGTVAIGKGAVGACVESNLNTAVGTGVMGALAGFSTRNAIFGYGAFGYTTGAMSWATAVGYEALAYAVPGGGTALGARALGSVTAGVNNVACGFDSGRFITVGSYNLAAGDFSGANIVAASRTISLGHATGATGDFSDLFVVGYNARATGPNQAVIGTAANFYRMALNHNAPTAWLHLPAGSAAVSSAPLKFMPGALTPAPENGAVEWDGSNIWFTQNDTRLPVRLGESVLKVRTEAYASSLSLSATAYDVYDITLTGPLTLDWFGGTDGKIVRCRLRQDVVGGRVLTLGTTIRTGTDIPAMVLSTTPFALDHLAFAYHAGDNTYHLISYARGYQ